MKPGVNPSFNSGANGNPCGSSTILPLPEVQSITLFSSTADLSGYFFAHFMGQTSHPIHFDDNIESVKDALEGMSTIFGVNILEEEFQSSGFYFGKRWLITFTMQKGGDLPSILVSTGSAPPSIVATGGTITGTSTFVEVEEISSGRLPTSFVFPTCAKGEHSHYFVRAKASNDNGWSEYALAPFSANTKKQVPSKPQEVRVQVISDTGIKVQWQYPRNDGGDPVIRYTIQWGTDYSFDIGSIDMMADQYESDYIYLIDSLLPGTSYHVRVLAYNSVGYGAAERATLITRTSRRVEELLLFEDNGDADLHEKFVLSYLSDGSFESTPELSVLAKAKDVETALNAITILGPISVTREDHSVSVDNTGIDTSFFRIIYRITFLEEADTGNLSFESDSLSTVTAEINLTSEFSGSDDTIVTTVQPPTGPEGVKLTQISRTELGVQWNYSEVSGGLPINKFLLEWSKESNQFEQSQVSPENLYSDLINGPVANSAVVTDTKYQIIGLHVDTTYFVRVSAYNSRGYSRPVTSSPASSITADVILYTPTSVSLGVSVSEIPNRLHLEWSLPTQDAHGFVTDIDSCEVVSGHTPNIATSYEIRWDTNPSMQNSKHYRALMIEDDGIPNNCCLHSKCSLEVGSEVQTITICTNTGTPLSGGSFKVVYVGVQSKSAKVTVTKGSSIVTVLSYYGINHVSLGDYMRINGNVYQVKGYSHPEITLSSIYDGTEVIETLVAYFETPPSTCFDAAGANSAFDMKSHIQLNFDDSPFNEEIRVSRSIVSSSENVALTYQVTFVGPAFHESVDEVLIVMDPLCDFPFEVTGSPSLAVTIEVETKMNSESLIPGISYFVEIAAVNEAGIGTFALSVPTQMAPRSPPSLAQNCRVYTVVGSSDSLRVEWNGVADNHGDGPESYRVDFFSGGTLAKSHAVNSIDEDSRYSIIKSGLTPGASYEVNIVAINDQGEGKFFYFLFLFVSSITLFRNCHLMIIANQFTLNAFHRVRRSIVV